MKAAYRIFLSRKVTLLLIFIQASCYFIGAVIPQRSIMTSAELLKWQTARPKIFALLESLGFMHVFSSRFTYMLTALFFLHLVLVTWQRIPAIRSTVRLPEKANISATSFNGLYSCDLLLPSINELSILTAILSGYGYKMIPGDGCFRGIKNRFSPIGSLLFHVSFIIMLAGGMLIFHSRFSGVTYVTEGQEFYGTAAEYSRIVRFSDIRSSVPHIAFRLISIKPEFEKNEAISIRTEIIPLYGKDKGAKTEFNVNYPYADGSVTMLVKDAGVAPFFEVYNRSENKLVSAFIPLRVLQGEIDSFPIPDTAYKVQVQFWPDYYVDPEGYIKTYTYYLKRPLFKITVFRDGKEIASGKLHSPSESLMFEGNRLSYKEIKYFGAFNVTSEFGGWVLITGFVIALAGLVTKLLFERREIIGMVSCKEDIKYVTLALKSEYYRSSTAQELDKIIAKAAGLSALQ